MSKKIALLIGNSEYTDKKLSRLKTPRADVNGVAQVLRNPEIGNFDDVTVLLNEKVDILRRQIARLFIDRQRDDFLLLYFTGHGVKDEYGQLHLAVSDTEHKFLDATAIPASYVTRHMDRSRSRRQVLLLDCCHSGAFEWGAKAALGEGVGAEAAFKGTGYGHYVLAASDAMQYAWEGDQILGKAETSVFTRFLIEGLQTGKADIDSDGLITIDELYDYIYERIIGSTSKQTPCKWTYGEQGNIAIARNPNSSVRQKEQMDVVTEIESALALRHSLIVKPPIADFTTRYPRSILFLGIPFVDTLFDVMESDLRIGNCGVTSFAAPREASSQSVVYLGLQVWLYDAHSRETSAINLQFPPFFYREYEEHEQKSTTKAETVRPNIGSVYYRETNNLLMQITILNFDTQLSLSLFIKSLIPDELRTFLARFLKKEGPETRRHDGVELRLRVWSKSQAARA
jgi:uncharacterized caspase-like protein